MVDNGGDHQLAVRTCEVLVPTITVAVALTSIGGLPSFLASARHVSHHTGGTASHVRERWPVGP